MTGTEYYTDQGLEIPQHFFGKKRKLAVNRKPTTGWPEWSVTTKDFQNFVNQPDVKGQLNADYTALPKLNRSDARIDTVTDVPNPWRELLCARMATILGVNEAAVLRRMYDVMNNKTHTVKAEFAEAAAIAVGRLLDHGTDMVVLPGNTRAARELIRVRAEMAKEELDEMTVNRLAQKTQRISQLIVQYPHNKDRLLNLAPYDCLRPPY